MHTWQDDYFDDPGVKPPLTGADVAGLVKLLEKVDDWGFDIHEFAGCVDRPLVSLMMYLLNRQGLVTCPPDGATDITEPSSTSDVPVSWQTACAYFTAIEEGYATCIQYHTARHGADTIHGTNYCLHQCVDGVAAAVERCRSPVPPPVVRALPDCNLQTSWSSSHWTTSPCCLLPPCTTSATSA